MNGYDGNVVPGTRRLAVATMQDLPTRNLGIDSGVRLIDTASLYVDGTAERFGMGIGVAPQLERGLLATGTAALATKQHR